MSGNERKREEGVVRVLLINGYLSKGSKRKLIK